MKYLVIFLLLSSCFRSEKQPKDFVPVYISPQPNDKNADDDINYLFKCDTVICIGGLYFDKPSFPAVINNFSCSRNAWLLGAHHLQDSCIDYEPDYYFPPGTAKPWYSFKKYPDSSICICDTDEESGNGIWWSGTGKLIDKVTKPYTVFSRDACGGYVQAINRAIKDADSAMQTHKKDSL